jgi:hypothetical protein
VVGFAEGGREGRRAGASRFAHAGKQCSQITWLRLKCLSYVTHVL